MTKLEERVLKYANIILVSFPELYKLVKVLRKVFFLKNISI